MGIKYLYVSNKIRTYVIISVLPQMSVEYTEHVLYISVVSHVQFLHVEFMFVGVLDRHNMSKGNDT